MEWNDFIKQEEYNSYIGQILTDIKCPICGRNIYLDDTVFLTSYPAQYSYWCECGWHGCSHKHWSK